jgi:hypothetical protein
LLPPPLLPQAAALRMGDNAASTFATVADHMRA